jgi:hypothetical protein
MGRSHKVDIGGLLAGSRQTMLLEDEVPVESFEGIEFPAPAKVRLEMRYADRMLHVAGSVDALARGH